MLGRVPGVMRAKASAQTKRISVVLDADAVSRETVQRALEAAGYQTR